jgi:hypothetical protein
LPGATSCACQALRSAHNNHQALAEEFKALQARNKELETSKSSGRARSRKSVLSSEDKEISLAGGRFSFAYELWVDSTTLDLECPIGVDIESPHRYDSALEQGMATIAEVYTSLSPSLRLTLSTPSRKEAFKSIVSPHFAQYYSS